MGTSIGRFAISALSATQETTLALLNLSFDFSLVRVEAPLEYRQIGQQLSKRRKKSAEVGDLHATARKLGALFAGLLPPIPHLRKSYGLRTSEIISNTSVNPPQSAAYGVFADHVGLDATSIWAAATSGAGAIEAHLLACLLARQWNDASQSISIWYQLVNARKKQLEGVLAEDEIPLSHINHLMQAQIDISISQLAEWDASARSVSLSGSRSSMRC